MLINILPLPLPTLLCVHGSRKHISSISISDRFKYCVTCILMDPQKWDFLSKLLDQGYFFGIVIYK